MKISDIPYWQAKGREGLDHAKLTYANIIEKQAKNIIIFVGDGMSLPTLTAARIHKAQRNSEYTAKGEETYLFFETLPHIGLSKVLYIQSQLAFLVKQILEGITHGLRTPRESFFSKISNFWAWADILG